MRKFGLTAGAVIALSCGIPGAAFAQDTPEDAGESADPSEAVESDGEDAEIFVTAQRRDERLQDVPISIQVQSAEQLAQTGIDNIQELGQVVPSLSVSTAVGFAITYLRGVGSTAIGPGIEMPISVYVDDVYYASSTSALFDFNNIDHVEVLKGPQGTLFGRNATGGLIHVITEDPTQELQLRVGMSIDNYLAVKGNVYAAGGIAPGVAADLSLSLSTQERGWGVNIPTGNDVNRNHHNISARSKWIFDIGADTTVELIGDYTDFRHSFNGQRIFPGTVTPPALGYSLNPGDPWDLNGDAEPRLNNTIWGTSLRVEHDFGGVILRNIAAYRRSKTFLNWDIDFTPIPHFHGDLDEIEKQFSEELQLSSDNSGPFVWTAGIYYFRARGIYDPSKVISLDVPNNIFGPFDTVSLFGNQLTESIAGYAQGTLEVLPETNLTLGVRYTHEKREIDGRTEATFFGDPTPILLATVPHDELTFEKPTFRVAIDHRFSPSALVYASFNTGFKSGGFNTQFASDPEFLPETIQAYEVGLKSDLADGMVRLNFAAFYYDYKNIQVQKVGVAATGIINGAAARIYGADLELDARLSPAFRLTGSAAYTNAQFTSFTNAPFATPGGGVPTFPGDASGNDIPKSPRFQANLAANYTADLNDGSEITATLAGQYSTRYFFEANNVVSQNAYARLNAAVTWTSADDRFLVGVFGNNLTNKAVGIYSSTLSDGTINVTFDAPRTVGVRGEFRY